MNSSSHAHFKQLIEAENFSRIEVDLMIELDRHDGIITTFIEEPDTGPATAYRFPTRCGFERDARNALPLAERLRGVHHDHQQVLAINQFLRELSVVNGIIHVLKHKLASDPNNALIQHHINKLKQHLVLEHKKLLVKPIVTTNHKEFFKTAEKDFHSGLLNTLAELQMLSGITTVSDLTDLLEHLRSLAAVLRPARSFVTLTKHLTATAGEILFIDAAHPITAKTAVQKQQIDLMAEEKSSAINYFTASSVAMKQVSTAFVNELKQDNTALPAQTRRTIAPTSKNAFVVHNRIIFPNGPAAEMYALRTGSTGYVGKGETPASVLPYAVENIKQLQAAAAALARKTTLYFNLLLTPHFYNMQDKMIDIARRASRALGISFSVLPVNLFGLTYNMDVNEKVSELAARQQRHMPELGAEYNLNKHNRTENASNIVNLALLENSSIAVVGCASGQDRTGTIMEVATILWAEEEFMKRDMVLNRDEIVSNRALGCHNAMLATLTAPGSAGMKKDSVPHYFPPAITNVYYRSTANTNKAPKIHYQDTLRVLKIQNPHSQTDLITSFAQDQFKILQAKTTDAVILHLTHFAKAALHYQRNKSTTGLYGAVNNLFRKFNKGSSAQEGLHIRLAVMEIAQALADIEATITPTELTRKLLEINHEIERFKSTHDSGKLGTVLEKLGKIIDATLIKLPQMADTLEQRHNAGHIGPSQ